jgi:sugar lactone lactonase YvrE
MLRPPMLRAIVVSTIVGVLVVLLCSGVPVTAHEVPATGPPLHAGVTPAISPPPSAFRTGMASSLVLGDPNFTTSWSTPNASAFEAAAGYASFDPHGDIWVPDFHGNRVLEFQPPFSNGEAASIVIGQSSFTGDAPGTTAVNVSYPGASTFDSHGDLWIVDVANNRVLEYVPPFVTGMAASLVLGQSNFQGSGFGATATNLSGPSALSFDALGDLWVADYDSSRVLEFVPPFTSGMAASLVIGQSDFTGHMAGLTAYNLSGPNDAVVAGNTLWVADGGGNRVLGFSAPFQTGESAYIVLGQSSFTTRTATGENAFMGSTGVYVDPEGNLWVSDWGDNRVLEFTPPFSTFQDPTVAIGQSTLTGTDSGDTATNLSFPYDMIFDSSGDLWVTDVGNNRVLEYTPSHYTVTVTPSGLRAGVSWTAIVDGQTETGIGSLYFSEPNGTHSLEVPPVAGLRSDPPVDQFVVNASATTLVVDFRATGPNPFSPGMPASLVLGQPNFDSAIPFGTAEANGSELSDANVGQASWNAAFDAHGNLWVADEGFNRVLEFTPPFTTFMTASLVLGQSAFSGTAAGDGASNLSDPNGLAFDASGNLWVSDSDNNRVVEFTTPFSTGMAASLVLGQTGFGLDASGSGSAQLHYPFGLAFDQGSLWVADSQNNRVVEYPAPFTVGEAATAFLGQSTPTGDQSGLSATNLSDASYIAFDSRGNVWVSDWFNNRVVEFPAPITTGEAATVVVGQPNLNTAGASYSDSLAQAAGIWMDGHGNLWVSDYGHNRVLEYAGSVSAIVTNQTPVVVLGQGNLTTTGANTSRTGLDHPTDVVGDPKGNIWVTDDYNNRVLEYAPAVYSLNFTATGLPSGTPWGVDVNGTAVPVSGAYATGPEENGTYDWTANVAGWTGVPSSGTATVNGANTTIAIAFTPVTYAVTFTETGLTPGTNWSVTIGTATHYSTGTTIGFTEPNGSSPYMVGTVNGYTAANASGVVTVNAATFSETITFTRNSSSTTMGLSSTDLLLLAVVIVVILAAVLAVVLMRRKKSSSFPPAPGAAPPGYGGAPPGAVAPPSPPGGPPPPGS